MTITRVSITSGSITRGAITSSSIGGGGGVNPPDNALFYRPFFTNSLDDTVNGADAIDERDSVKTANGEEFPANAPAFDGVGWNMESTAEQFLQNPSWSGGGSSPTNWTQAAGTGTSTPTDEGIYFSYLQSATSERPFFQTNTLMLAANTDYIFSYIVESVSGVITAGDVIQAVGLPAGASFSYPVCEANTAGGSGGSVSTGVLQIYLTYGANAGTSDRVRAGLGCGGNVTGSLMMSRPQLEVGTARTSWINFEGVREDDNGSDPVGTMQVDANHGLSGSGVISLAGTKYDGLGAAGWINAVFQDDDNIQTAKVTAAVAGSITVSGTVSLTDKLFFHTSDYPDLTSVQTLRSNAGDTGPWTVIPLNDFYREVEFCVNVDVDHNSIVSGRYIDASNGDVIVYDYDATLKEIKVLAGFNVAGSNDAIGTSAIPYTLGDSIKARVNKRSSGLTDIVVTINGTPYNDDDTITYDLVQGVKNDYGNFAIGSPDPFYFTLISDAVGTL